MATPHISASEGDFAESILLPGDPLRAQYIAENFLENVREVTSVRNMLGFTGSYQGTDVSVMGTGMGIPSASIYANELVDQYGVKNLVRVGSCGAIHRDVKVRDVLLASGACTDSGVNRARYGGYDFAATADFGLLRAAAEAAETLDVEVRFGNVHSSDHFYNPEPEMFDVMEKMGVLAVEMEAAGLYAIAHEKGARALAILTVSDHIRTGEATTAEERQTTFEEMMRIALDSVSMVAS